MTPDGIETPAVIGPADIMGLTEGLGPHVGPGKGLFLEGGGGMIVCIKTHAGSTLGLNNVNHGPK